VHIWCSLIHENLIELFIIEDRSTVNAFLILYGTSYWFVWNNFLLAAIIMWSQTMAGRLTLAYKKAVGYLSFWDKYCWIGRGRLQGWPDVTL
jgi:hypothetical protein